MTGAILHPAPQGAPQAACRTRLDVAGIMHIAMLSWTACLAVSFFMLPVQPAGFDGMPRAHAQAAPDAPAGTNAAGGGMALHVPDKMISGDVYEGMVRVPVPPDTDMTIQLASMDSRVRIPATATIPAGYNHGVFGISPDPGIDGEVTFHAIYNDMASQAVSTVYSVADTTTSLRLVSPTGDAVRTLDKHVPIMVVTTDNHGIPVRTDRDVLATLTATAGITFSTSTNEGASNPMTVRIPNGTHTAIVHATIPDSGHIYAQAEGFGSARMETERGSDMISVRAAVTPIPAAAGTVGELFVWFEDSDTNIYIPDSIPEAIITAQHDAVHLPGGSDKLTVMRLEDPVSVMQVYFIKATPPDRPATISVQVPGVGVEVAEAVVIENNREFLNRFNNDGEVKTLEIKQSVNNTDVMVEFIQYSKLVPDIACVWTYPATPHKTGYAVTGIYAQNRHTNTTAVCPDTASEVQYEEVKVTGVRANATEKLPLLIPVKLKDMPAQSSVFTASSEGIRIEQEIEIRDLMFDIKDLSSIVTLLDTDDIAGLDISDVLEKRVNKLPSSSIVKDFKVVESADHNIVAGGTGLRSDTSDFSSSGQYGTNHGILVSGIPAIRNLHGNIAFASIVNPDGHIVDHLSRDTRLADNIISQTGDAIKSLDIRILSDTVGIISGTHTRDSASIHMIVPGLASEAVELRPSGTVTGIEVWMPPHVSATQEFPVSIHGVNDNGTPITRLGEADVTPSDGQIAMRQDGRHVRGIAMHQANATDIHYISKSRHIATAPLDSMLNDISGSAFIESVSGQFVKLGEKIILDVATRGVADPDIDIAGDLDFVFNEDSGFYEAVPPSENVYDVAVTVSGRGWTATSETYTWNVEHMVDVTGTVRADDGARLPVSANLTAFGRSHELGSGKTISTRAGIYDIAMPDRYVHDNRGYTLKSINSSGEFLPPRGSFAHMISDDTDLTFLYELEIEVAIDGFLEDPGIDTPEPVIGGNGLYGYGDMVTITAAPVPELYGLIWHIPESWSDLPAGAVASGGTATFEAASSVYGSVYYQKNYTFLMLLVGLGVAVPVILIRWRSPETFWNVADFVRQTAARMRRPKRARSARPAGPATAGMTGTGTGGAGGTAGGFGMVAGTDVAGDSPPPPPAPAKAGVLGRIKGMFGGRQ